ncbi:MAG TPA: hypothetical protein PLR99_29790 [Polyangiaceae bacterium]|nr:hypothetical protein [Polyangiaceae bacterium]
MITKTCVAWGLAVGIAVGAPATASAVTPATPTNTLKSLTLSGTGLSTVRIADQYGEFASVGLFLTGTSRGTAEWTLALPSTTTVRTGTALSLQIRLSAGADNATTASQLHACAVIARQRGAASLSLGFKAGYSGGTFTTVASNGTIVNAAIDSSAITSFQCD